MIDGEVPVIDELFTNLADLDKQEPQSRVAQVQKCPFEEEEQKQVRGDTPVSLLRSAVLMHYHTEPNVVEKKLPSGEFAAEYIVRGYSGTGVARNKRLAKQMAARRCLYAIIDDGKHIDFSIPGANKEEARKFVAKHKIQIPKPEFSEIMEGNSPMHFCKVEFEGQEFECSSRTKKDAQNQVFGEIFPILMSVVPNEQEMSQMSIIEKPKPVLNDNMTAVELAAYLDYAVQGDRHPKIFKGTDYKRAIEVIARFRNPNGELLLEGYKYTILTGQDRPVIIGVLDLNGLLMGKGSEDEAVRRDHSFHGMDKNGDEKVVFEEASWRALEFIKNYGNFRTNLNDEPKVPFHYDSSLTKSEVDAMGLDLKEPPAPNDPDDMSSLTHSSLLKEIDRKSPVEFQNVWHAVHQKLEPVD